MGLFLTCPFVSEQVVIIITIIIIIIIIIIIMIIIIYNNSIGVWEETSWVGLVPLLKRWQLTFWEGRSARHTCPYP